MPVFDTLVDAYRREGFSISSGLSPTLTGDYFLAPFTWLVRDGEAYTDGLGISLQEAYFLEVLSEVVSPASIFAIGNGFGWSTLVLAAANPGAEVVVIDSGTDVHAAEGLELTRKIAANLGLDVEAVRATSPQDVGRVVTGHLAQPIDLAFVDGFHSAEQIVADWRALAPFLSERAVVVFHDVLFLRMIDGFDTVVNESGWQGHLLWATSTGMGILAQDPDEPLARVIRAFSVDPDARRVVAAMGEREVERRPSAQLRAAVDELQGGAAG